MTDLPEHLRPRSLIAQNVSEEAAEVYCTTFLFPLHVELVETVREDDQL